MADNMLVRRYKGQFVGKCPKCGVEAIIPYDLLGVLLDCPKYPDCDWSGYARVQHSQA